MPFKSESNTNISALRWIQSTFIMPYWKRRFFLNFPSGGNFPPPFFPDSSFRNRKRALANLIKLTKCDISLQQQQSGERLLGRRWLFPDVNYQLTQICTTPSQLEWRSNHVRIKAWLTPTIMCRGGQWNGLAWLATSSVSHTFQLGFIDDSSNWCYYNRVRRRKSEQTN